MSSCDPQLPLWGRSVLTVIGKTTLWGLSFFDLCRLNSASVVISGLWVERSQLWGAAEKQVSALTCTLCVFVPQLLTVSCLCDTQLCFAESSLWLSFCVCVLVSVGYILNVTREIDNFFPESFTYMNIRVYDVEGSDLLAHWPDTYTFISTARYSWKPKHTCQEQFFEKINIQIVYCLFRFYSHNHPDAKFDEDFCNVLVHVRSFSIVAILVEEMPPKPPPFL